MVLRLRLILPSAANSAASVRQWDELRTSELEPYTIASVPYKLESDSVGGVFGSLGSSSYFGKHWLRIEGASKEDNFLSHNFRFKRLDYPHEWAAEVLQPGAVRLHLGRCECILAGVAAYLREDQSAWLRLQFEDCRDCESTASSAAVVVPLGVASDPRHGCNLLAWMCALSDHAACGAAPPVRPTAATTERVPAAPSAAPTTHKPECHFQGQIAVAAFQNELGAGRCGTNQQGGRVQTHKSRSLQGCQIACQLTYGTAAASYTDLQDVHEHIVDINHAGNVCKGFAYNMQTEDCSIYFGALNVYDAADGNQSWSCYGNVHVKEDSFTYHSSFGRDCSTLASTSTVTTATVTSTTTTITPAPVPLHLGWLLGPQAEEGQIYGLPGEAYFPGRSKAEATLMQLQSACYWNVDYYLLSTPLLVTKDSWAGLQHLISSYGDAQAWKRETPQALSEQRCQASITIDRLPVEADIPRRYGDQASLSWFQRGLLELLVPFGLGAAVAVASMLVKRRYHPDYSDPQSPSEQEEKADAYMTSLGALAVFLLALALVYWLAQFTAWFVRRLAVKRFALGYPADLLCAAPLLSYLALPTALTAACGAAVIWLWPKEEPDRGAVHYVQQALHISYDPVSRHMESFVA